MPSPHGLEGGPSREGPQIGRIGWQGEHLQVHGTAQGGQFRLQVGAEGCELLGVLQPEPDPQP